MVRSIENKSKDKTSDFRNNICWILGVVMFVIGALNIIEVHVIPGSFYILFAVILIPVSDVFLKMYLGSNIPFRVKVVLFILVMWGTLGVGDLAEIYGL